MGKGSTTFYVGHTDAVLGAAYRGDYYGVVGTFRRNDYDEGWQAGQAELKYDAVIRDRKLAQLKKEG